MTQVILGKSRVREICMPGSVRAKAKWLSYSTYSPSVNSEDSFAVAAFLIHSFQSRSFRTSIPYFCLLASNSHE